MTGGGGAADGLLVTLGAVPGAWLRYRIVNHLAPVLPRRHWGTFGVNVGACLALGLIVGLAPRCGEGSRRLLLLLTSGFLGSFSTLSTWSAEVRAELVRRRWGSALGLAGGSVTAGMLAVAAGLALAGGP